MLNHQAENRATYKTWTILTPEPSKNQVVFLTRNSVAVAHVVAQCTNRCTRRKVIVNAQPPRRKPKMKKICWHENRKTARRKSARGTSSSGEQREGERNEGRAEWLRIRREQSSHPNRVRIKLYLFSTWLFSEVPWDLCTCNFYFFRNLIIFPCVGENFFGEHVLQFAPSPLFLLLILASQDKRY